MDLLKKTIILTSSDIKYGGMGVLTLIKGDNGIFGNFKTYNVKACYNSILGIVVNDKAIKQNVNINENNNFKLEDDFDINCDISCVLVDKEKENVTPLIWFSANSEVNKFTMMNTICKTINNSKSNLSEKSESDLKRLDYYNNKFKDIELKLYNSSNLNKKDNNYFNNDDIETISNIDNNVEQIANNYIQSDNYNYLKQKNNQCKEIKVGDESKIIPSKIDLEDQENYVAKFSDKRRLFEYNEDDIEDEIDKNLEGDKPFFELISDQVEELFSKYPTERYLESVIDNSKWVKIDFENNGKYYVLGLIYENSNVKYVCYGVPGKFGNNPPKEIEDYNQWVPFDFNNSSGDGYWIMYQDALTGESINLNIG